MYSISYISESWISIDYADSFLDIRPMILLLKSIQKDIGGEIVRVDQDDDVFTLTNDQYKSKFQWDSCFGCNVVLNNIKDKNKVMKWLQFYLDNLNKSL